jgi:ketosteroid isomerase-like protein
MSQENVELVRHIYALLDQGDEAVWDLASPGFVLDFSRRHIDPVVLRGRDQILAWSEREVAEAWEGGRTGWQPQELIDAGDKVLALVRATGRGKASGIEVEAYVWNVWTIRDGELAEWTYFGEDRAAAFEAVGLTEQDAHADS